MPQEMPLKLRSPIPQTDPIAAFDELMLHEASKLRRHAARIEAFVASSRASREGEVEPETPAPSLPLTALPTVEKDEFKDKSPGVALEMYMRKRAGHRIPLLTIIDDLLKGNVNPGKHGPGPRDPKFWLRRRVKQALSSNVRLYRHEPEGTLSEDEVEDSEITAWLKPGVENLPVKRRYGKKH